jgi:hypothetical protein
MGFFVFFWSGISNFRQMGTRARGILATCLCPNVTPRHIYCEKSATEFVLFLFFGGEITSHAKFVSRTCFFFFYFLGASLDSGFSAFSFLYL